VKYLYHVTGIRASEAYFVTVFLSDLDACLLGAEIAPLEQLFVHKVRRTYDVLLVVQEDLTAPPSRPLTWSYVLHPAGRYNWQRTCSQGGA